MLKSVMPQSTSRTALANPTRGVAFTPRLGARRQLRRRLARIATVAIAMAVPAAGCQRPQTAPRPALAVAACPGPVLDTRDWRLVMDSADLSYRLPPALVERADTASPHRRWFSADSRQIVTVGFIHELEHWITLRRAPSPGMHEMSECIDSIPGRQLLVQAWRTAGGVFRDRRRFDNYEMLALVPIEPGLTVFLTGGGSARETQVLLLAIARTVRIGEP
jgi:hypothetical protein